MEISNYTCTTKVHLELHIHKIMYIPQLVNYRNKSAIECKMEAWDPTRRVGHIHGTYTGTF